MNRAYALVDATYADIQPFGRAMFRRGGPEQLFPSLFSVRASPTRKRVEPAADDLFRGDDGGETEG